MKLTNIPVLFAVTNVKSYSTDSVVQHTFALLFYVYEKLRHYDDFVKDGKYCEYGCFTYFGQHFEELAGKTWGIIGLGEIGRRVADIAKAFGCHVIYYSTSGKNSNPDYERVDFDELLERSDIISIHAPLNDRTENLMDRQAFGKMKSNAVLIMSASLAGSLPVFFDNTLTFSPQRFYKQRKQGDSFSITLLLLLNFLSVCLD